jgi:hypothetical protein
MTQGPHYEPFGGAVSEVFQAPSTNAGASRKWLRYLGGEVVQVPYEKGVSLPAYFIKPKQGEKHPGLSPSGDWIHSRTSCGS